MAKLKVKAITKNGKKRWVIDFRETVNRKTKGQRKFFATKAEADRYLEAKKPADDGEKPIVLVGQEKRIWLTLLDLVGGIDHVIEAGAFYRRTHQPTEEVKLARAIGECVAAKRRSGKDGDYLRIFESRLEALATSQQQAGRSMVVSEITQEDVERAIHRDGLGPASKRGHLIDYRTFFNFCAGQGWCIGNPCENIEEIEVGGFARAILKPVEAEIFIRTAAETEPALVRYLVDQLFGGMREDEAWALESWQVQDGYIDLPETKTKEPRYVEWNDTWKSWRTKFPGEYARTEKEMLVPIRNLNRRVARIKKAAKAKLLAKKLVDEKWWWPRNCLRHSFCTYAAKKWGPGRAAELAGHSEKVQKDHYRRPVTLEEADRFWGIVPEK